MTTQTITLDAYYREVMHGAKARTVEHAARLSQAVLHVLGFNLSSGIKRKLTRSLPEPLGHELTRGWRLIHFRDRHLSRYKFLKAVGLQSGNTDPQYAALSTAAVFRQLKQFLDGDLSREVAKDLSPEVRELWNAA